MDNKLAGKLATVTAMVSTLGAATPRVATALRERTLSREMLERQRYHTNELWPKKVQRARKDKRKSQRAARKRGRK